MKIEGLGRYKAKVEASPGRVRRGVVAAMNTIGPDLKRRSQAVAPYRPGDTEHLRDKAYHFVGVSGGDPFVEIGYEGPADYLLVQHFGGWESFMGTGERKEITNYTTPGTGPHFLSGPWLANKEGYARDVMDAMREGLPGG